jgi:hypothetical protein
MGNIEGNGMHQNCPCCSNTGNYTVTIDKCSVCTKKEDLLKCSGCKNTYYCSKEVNFKIKKISAKKKTGKITKTNAKGFKR